MTGEDIARIDGKKIYVAIPSFAKTGGGESLHHLVDVCNRNGMDAYVYYYDHPAKFVSCQKFSNLNLRFAEIVEDDDRNVLLVPEMCTFLLNRFKKVKTIIWWLSLLFYLKSSRKYSELKYSNYEILLDAKSAAKRKNIREFSFPYSIFRLMEYNMKFPSKQVPVRKMRYIDLHLYNCEYAHEFLAANGINNTQYVCGPINEVFFEDYVCKERKDIILYNPSKSNVFTELVIKELKIRGITKIIPLKGYNYSELLDLYSSSKIYMDFGDFPGPERIPREAVIRGCNIIVTDRGAAKNNIDIPIPDEFKFRFVPENVVPIVTKIELMLKDYEQDFHKFDAYREKVKEQRKNFESSVIDVMRRVLNDIE